MKAIGLLTLFLASFSAPSLASAQGLPPLWEPCDWVNRDTLWERKTTTTFAVSGAGRLVATVDEKDAGLVHPPAIWLLDDKAFRKELCRTPGTNDASDVEEEIGRRIAKYHDDFNALLGTTEKLEPRERRVAEIDAFERQTRRMLDEMRGLLTPAQVETCERRYHAGLFYSRGPMEFARRMGAKESDLELLASRLEPLRDPLRARLRELETATLLEVLETLDGQGVEAMRELVRKASPRRFGCLFTLYDELANFDAPPVGMTKETPTHERLYRMTPAGEYLPGDESPTDPINELVYLFSVQEILAEDRENAFPYLSYLFGSGPGENVEREALYREARDLYFKSRRDKEVDAFAAQARIAEIWSEVYKLRWEEVESVEKLMTDDGRRAIEAGRLLFYMQRYGCIAGLASKHANERFGLLIDAASWKALDAKAPEIAAALRDRALKLQQEVLKDLFRDTSLAKQAEAPWVLSPDAGFMPPLETLIHHVQTRR